MSSCQDALYPEKTAERRVQAGSNLHPNPHSTTWAPSPVTTGVDSSGYVSLTVSVPPTTAEKLEVTFAALISFVEILKPTGFAVVSFIRDPDYEDVEVTTVGDAVHVRYSPDQTLDEIIEQLYAKVAVARGRVLK